MAAGDWARAIYANDDAIRHYERALRTLAEPRRTRRRDGRGRGRGARRARAPRRPVRPAGAAHRGAGAVRASCSRRSNGSAIRCGPRACCARSAACTGRPASASAPAPASTPACERLGDEGDAIERAHLFQEMGRLAFRAGDNATALALAQRALAEVPAEARRARARGHRRARRGLQHARRRAGAAGPAAEAVAADRKQRRPGRGEPPAAGGLPRLHQPGRAVRVARSAAQHRDLPARARNRARRSATSASSRGCTPTSRSPTAR